MQEESEGREEQQEKDGDEDPEVHEESEDDPLDVLIEEVEDEERRTLVITHVTNSKLWTKIEADSQETLETVLAWPQFSTVASRAHGNREAGARLWYVASVNARMSQRVPTTDLHLSSQEKTMLHK